MHVVLFVVQPQEVVKYRKDSLMWARQAKKFPGFLAYRTMKRYGFRGQYISVYQWAGKSYHDCFMRKYHDWLVSKSEAKVEVLDYYNFKQLDNLRL